ncbi:3'5'-cyclic nucleotide phosphodiesterase, partial [Opisthorchis viverrini]
MFSDVEIKPAHSSQTEHEKKTSRTNIPLRSRFSKFCCWSLCASSTRKRVKEAGTASKVEDPPAQSYLSTKVHESRGLWKCSKNDSRDLSPGTGQSSPLQTSADSGVSKWLKSRTIPIFRLKTSPKRSTTQTLNSLHGSPSSLISSAPHKNLDPTVSEHLGFRTDIEQPANTNEAADISSKATEYICALQAAGLDFCADDRTSLSSNASDSDLRRAISYCEKRLDRLSQSLMCIRNYFTQAKSQDQHQEHVGFTGQPAKPVAPEPGVFLQKVLDIEDWSASDFGLVEHQINQISQKLQRIKYHIDARAYLGWIGIARAPHWNDSLVPGKSASPPNPQIQLIRRTEAECRDIVLQYKTLCDESVPYEVRMELRQSTFNNWPWSDAWLIRLVRQMFMDLGLIEQFRISVSRLDTWLCDIYRRYNRVPFHNYKHAFMVTQMAYSIIWTAKLTEYLDKEEQLILLASAICHDLDHPGFNNAYQINASTVLAIRYNDQSPLENHHAAMAFDILKTEEANPFDHLEEETYKRIREGIIRCILATDMSRHNDILNQFVTVVLGDLATALSMDKETQRPRWVLEKNLRDLTLMIIMKVCDISNEARPLHVSAQWINRLLAEFFHQSDYEKLAGLPVAPFMDREKVTKSASQCGFIRFVILPLFEALAKLLPQIQTAVVQPAIEQLNYYTEMQASELRKAGYAKEDNQGANSDG